MIPSPRRITGAGGSVGEATADEAEDAREDCAYEERVGELPLRVELLERPDRHEAPERRARGGRHQADAESRPERLDE
jgi:hypothetical protein